MAKTRGFKLSHKLVKVFNYCILRRGTRHGTSTTSKLIKWVHSLKRGAKTFVSTKTTHSNSYMRVGDQDMLMGEKMKLRKGHLAVYVGNMEDDETCRVMVPVIWFNHPLFGELLREAEKVYGFGYSGGIKIPCHKSELDDVRMKIAADGGGSGGGIWRRCRRSLVC